MTTPLSPPASEPASPAPMGKGDGGFGPHLIPTDHLPGFTPERKAAYVNTMFDTIAPRYDLMNRLMTFGMDRGWRNYVVAQAAPPVGGSALDVATGTGDIAIALAERVGPGGTVLATDFSEAMMRPGPRKAIRAGVGSIVRFMAADALDLPFPDDTFDCVTTGFAMRNVTDIERAFREMRRVTKPGGRVVCLEVAKPGFPPVRFLHQRYFNWVVPLLGRIITGHGEAYRYLPESARNFPPPPALKAIMERAGLHAVHFRRLSLGAVAVHTGTK
ncbi:MAG: bifunctional demethylmenaquinone methyltransferase/2-methoxy-6-polyprenyl-1,4-benzoquinol methylase UbiE [Chloroflexota bacterium]|nr:bifunctional demethylmenaquinone methyltransferase/2-methoxy-6-polyprenyl-1,4-benzoquinol methylase UbiE [Chloroflexota bacterium]